MRFNQKADDEVEITRRQPVRVQMDNVKGQHVYVDQLPMSPIQEASRITLSDAPDTTRVSL